MLSHVVENDWRTPVYMLLRHSLELYDHLTQQRMNIQIILKNEFFLCLPQV